MAICDRPSFSHCFQDIYCCLMLGSQSLFHYSIALIVSGPGSPGQIAANYPCFTGALLHGPGGLEAILSLIWEERQQPHGVDSASQHHSLWPGTEVTPRYQPGVHKQGCTSRGEARLRAWLPWMVYPSWRPPPWSDTQHSGVSHIRLR